MQFTTKPQTIHSNNPVGQIPDNTCANELYTGGGSNRVFTMFCSDRELYPNWQRPMYDISGNFAGESSEIRPSCLSDYFADMETDTDSDSASTEMDEDAEDEDDADSDSDDDSENPTHPVSEKIDLQMSDNSMEYWYHNQTDNYLYDNTTMTQNPLLGWYYK